MTKEKKLIQFTTELIQKTINKEILWKQINIPTSLSEGTDFIIPLCFETKYNNKTFILFKRRYQNYSFDFDKMYWAEECKLGILENNIVIWENKENISSLTDLFNHVQEKVSGLDDFLDNL